MKNNDKILVAFLVSLGVFSSGIATQYVNSLSLVQKKALSDARVAGANLSPVDGNNTLPIPVDTDK